MSRTESLTRNAGQVNHPPDSRPLSAIYARFSSDLQRPASIEDQVRNCREFSEREELALLPEHIFVDEEKTGSVARGRDEYNRLMDLVASGRCPFKALIVDDTSRFGRNVSQVTQAARILEFYDIRVVFLAQGIDSGRTEIGVQLAIFAAMDEQQNRVLAYKVRSAQKGRLLNGYVPGGKTYGYRNVTEDDPNRRDRRGRASQLGVRYEVVPEEAAVLIRIFEMHLSGKGYGAIAECLNEEDVPPPEPASHRVRCAWGSATIRSMIFNEMYRGRKWWGRTKKTVDPIKDRKTRQDMPEEEWILKEDEAWRIVPEELWQAVHSRLEGINESRKANSLGGLSFTRSGKVYLFSGILKCGVCGSSIVICSGGGKRGYVKYGCNGRKQSGPTVCSNGHFIRQDRLEAQLLEQIEDRVFRPKNLDRIVAKCAAELKRRNAEAERGNTIKALHKERAKLDAQADNLTDAIAQGGQIQRLKKKLDEVEERLEGIKARIVVEESRHTTIPKFTAKQIRSTILDTMKGLRDALNNEDREQAKAVLHRQIEKLVLTPLEKDGRVVFEVSGEFDPNTYGPGEGDGKCRKLLVARDGIEPPTPAFSGPRSTN